MSYDLDDVEGIAAPEYMELIKRLNSYNTGPMVMRIGATKADRLKQVWDDKVLEAMATLYRTTGE